MGILCCFHSHMKPLLVSFPITLYLLRPRVQLSHLRLRPRGVLQIIITSSGPITSIVEVNWKPNIFGGFFNSLGSDACNNGNSDELSSTIATVNPTSTTDSIRFFFRGVDSSSIFSTEAFMDSVFSIGTSTNTDSGWSTSGLIDGHYSTVVLSLVWDGPCSMAMLDKLHVMGPSFEKVYLGEGYLDQSEGIYERKVLLSQNEAT